MTVFSYVETILKKLGVVARFDKDDVVNAEIEDSLREISKQVESYHGASRERSLSNQVLRHAIELAKERTSSFKDMEKFVRHQGDRK